MSVVFPLIFGGGPGGSGGGSDPNFKGYFVDEAALTTAYPTGQNGWYAIVGTTDTIWIWDGDTTAWVDSGNTSSIGGSVEKIPFTETIEIANLLQYSPNYSQIGVLNLIKGALSTFINGVYEVGINCNGSAINFDSNFEIARNDYSDLGNPVGKFRFIFALMSDGIIGVSIYQATEIAFPTISSATVENATPDELDIVLSEACNITDLTGQSLLFTVGTSKTITSIISGSGTTNLKYQLSASIEEGDVFTLEVLNTNTISSVATGNGLQPISFNVNNNITGLNDPVTLNPEFLFEGFNPNNGALPADSDPITTVINRGTEAINATKASAGSLDFRNTGGKLYLQNSDDVHLDVLSGAYAQAYTVIIAVSADVIGTNQELMASKDAGNRSFSRIKSTNAFSMWAVSELNYASGTAVAGNDYIIQCVFSGANSKIRVNNGAWTTGTVSTGAFTDFTLLASNVGGISNPFVGKFYGAFVKSVLMPDTDIQEVVDWFEDKGGMIL